VLVAAVVLAGGGWWAWTQYGAARNDTLGNELTATITPQSTVPTAPSRPAATSDLAASGAETQGNAAGAAAAPQPAPEAFTQQASIQDPSGYTLVRNSPSPIGISIARVDTGESVTTFPQTGDWRQVRTQSGAIGYVRSDSLRIGDTSRASQAQRAERPRAPRGPRVRYVNSDNMRLFCAGPGKGTPQCRTFRAQTRR
jgi:hypothetical protein